jgi:hypothetical protein
MNINAEHQCRERIDAAIDGVAPDDAMAALITSLVDHTMMLEQNGRPISATEVKRLLAEVIGQVVDVCFAFDSEPDHVQ